MWKVLEIFGRAVNIETSQIMWHWLNTVINRDNFDENRERLTDILDKVSNIKLHLADELIKEYLVDFPLSTSAMIAETIVALKRNQLEYCIEILNKICSLEAFNTMALYGLGHCHERLQNEDVAIGYYQDCIKFKGYLQLPRQRLAAIHLKKGNISESIEQYEQLCKEYPDCTDSYLLLGYLYLANMQYDIASEAFDKSIMLHPDNFQESMDCDEINRLMESNDLDAATTLIMQMFEEIGELPEIYIKLSEVHLRRDEIDEAIACLKRACRIQPNNMQATIKLATLYLKTNRLSQASEYFNKALEFNDEIVDAYIGLAKAQLMAGKSKESLDTISLAGAIQQNSTLLYCESAALQYKISHNSMGFKQEIPIENLIAIHRDKSEKSNSNSDNHYKYGLITLASGDHKFAAKQFTKSLANNSYHFRAKSKLIISNFELGNRTKCLELLGDVESLNREIFELHYDTAILYSNRNKFEDAMEKLYKSMEDNYINAESINNISVVLENIGLVDRAAANFVRLERICQN